MAKAQVRFSYLLASRTHGQISGEIFVYFGIGFMWTIIISDMNLITKALILLAHVAKFRVRFLYLLAF